MAKVRHHVQVCYKSCKKELGLPLIMEQLKYSGVVGDVREEETDSGYILHFCIFPPHHIKFTEVWAASNAERIRSFGIDASMFPVS